MKLLIAIISSDDVNEVCERLRKNLIPSSRISSTRSFLSSYTSTLMVACEDLQVEEALDIIKNVCGTRPAQFVNSSYGSQLINSAEEGGGAVFVVDLEQYIKL